MSLRRQQTLFRISWVLMLLLDWIPGYCRHYTLRNFGSVHRRSDWQRHWVWQWRARWGTRLVNRLGLMGPFSEECERRAQLRKPSSAS